MEKQKLAEGILLYKNVITNSKNLVEEIENDVALNLTQWTASAVKSSEGTGTNKMVRDTDAIGIPYLGKVDNNYTSIYDSFYKKINNYFYEAFSPIEDDYKKEFGISTEWHDSWSILKYGRGQFFTNHIDDDISYPRRISTVYYLNDDYEGGEINFPRHNLIFKPSKNDLIIFPSSFVYNHSVNPVNSGTRYAVVGWMRWIGQIQY